VRQPTSPSSHSSRLTIWPGCCVCGTWSLALTSTVLFSPILAHAQETSPRAGAARGSRDELPDNCRPSHRGGSCVPRARGPLGVVCDLLVTTPLVEFTAATYDDHLTWDFADECGGSCGEDVEGSPAVSGVCPAGRSGGSYQISVLRDGTSPRPRSVWVRVVVLWGNCCFSFSVSGRAHRRHLLYFKRRLDAVMQDACN
jgi:hypothetical protein